MNMDMPKLDDAIRAAYETVRNFISEELECREASLLPISCPDDIGYIDSAKAALSAADQLGVHLGVNTGQKL
jgi:hypothetical protein